MNVCVCTTQRGEKPQLSLITVEEIICLANNQVLFQNVPDRGVNSSPRPLPIFLTGVEDLHGKSANELEIKCNDL